MADATANLRLGLIDDGFITGIKSINSQLDSLQLASTAVSVALPLLEKGLRSNASQFLVGAQNAEKLSIGLGNLIEVNKSFGNILGKATNVAFYSQQLAILSKGALDAYSSLKRIPEALEQMERSGVSTGSIQGFMTLRDAIGGSQAAVESFAQTAVSKLNAVEAASARVGTILKSSTNFNDQGIAKRAGVQELTQNRRQLQTLVREKLDNNITTTDALMGQYEVLSGGFTSTKASQQVLESGGKLIGIAGAGGQAVDPTSTLQLLVKTLRAYGFEASQAARVSAILNATVDSGITTIQELSQNFGQASQVAKTAGIAIEDLAAATAVLTAQGTSTPVALTGIQTLANSIISKTPEAAKAIAKLRTKDGERIRFDVREVQQKGLTGAITDLLEASGGNQEILSSIFPDSLAYRTFLGLSANKGQDFSTTASSIKSGANVQSLDEVYGLATNDRISRFEKIANRFEETIVQIGESLAPVFEPGIAYLEKISKLISDIPEPIKKAIGGYLAFKIQATAMGVAFKQFGGAIVSVIGNIAVLRAVNLLMTGQFGKQIAVIKDLILQKKGLGAVIKQLIGLDQSHLLVTKEATEAIAKEGAIQKTVNAVREQANNVVKKNIKGFVEQTEAVKNSGAAVNGAKGKFSEYIETIRNTTVGKKIDEITGKFTGQREAIRELAKGTQEYFNGLKNASVEQAEQLKNQVIKQPTRPIDAQIEAYKQKRLAEIEKSLPDSPDSFGGLLEVDPEAQREARRRELLAERDRRNQQRRQRKLEQFIPDVEGKTFGESFGLVSSFGDFADLEEREAQNRRKQYLESVRRGRSSRKSGAVSNAVEAVSGGIPFGDFILGDIEDQKAGRNTLREKARSRGFGNLNKVREEANLAARSVATQVSLFESLKSVSTSAFSAMGTGAKAGFGLITELAGGAIAALGPIVPIGLAIGAAFAFAGKEITHLFGGGAANALSKGIEETTKALKELEKESGRDGALLSLKGDLADLAEGKNNFLKPLQSQIDTFRTTAPQEIEGGILDKVRSSIAAPFEELKNLANNVKDTTGSFINGIFSPGENFTLPKDLEPIQSRLTQLREEGTLTSGQFTAMSQAFKKAGEDGKVTAQELSVLQNQVEAFRAGAPGVIEEGVIDKIKKTFSMEGLGRFTNYVGNTLGAAATNILSPLGEFATAESVNANREADSLIKPLSKLRQEILNPAGDANVQSIEQTKKLSEGIFLTQEARDLAAKGSQIQGVALAKENKKTDDLIKKNETLISGFQAQAEARAKLINETTDEGLKQQLKDQFDSAQTQIDNLQKRTEALKQAREQITKYYNETLPVLQQAVINSSVNPLEGNGALDDAFSVFKEKYIDEGKKFLKDVQQQRTEGQAVLDQILQNYDRNLLGSADVANKVKDVLEQSFITLTKDGKQIKGSIFDIDTQKNLISQIAQFSSQATGERLAQIDIESAAVAAAGQQRKASEESVSKKSVELQQEKLKLQKTQLEEEIKLRTQYGIKTTDLENQLKQTNLQIAQSEFDAREKLIQRQLNLQIQAIEVQRSSIGALTAERGISEENAQKKMAELQIKESELRANELKRQLDEFKANGVKNVELENQYAQARNQIRELEAKEKERLIQQELQQRTQALEIEKNKVQVLAEEGLIGQEDVAKELAKFSVDQAQLKADDLERQINQLKANGQSSVSLEQEYAQQRLQIRSLEAREKKRLIEQELQEKIKALDIEQLKTEVGISERTISERDGQKAVAQSRLEQEKLRLGELERQLNLLKSNGQESVSLEQEVSTARLRIRKAEADEKNRLEDLAFEIQKKRLELESQRAGLRQQQLDAEYEALQKQSQLIEAITNSRNQLADTESRYVQNQLQNQAKLTRDPLKQAEIELRILGEREADLARTQKAELESLAIRQKLAAIDLQRQQTQIQTQKLELESQAQILAIELQRAESQKRSPEEIEAIKLQIQGNKIKSESLNQQLSLTNQQLNQQNEINSNEQKRIKLSQQTELENIQIEKTLARQKILHEQIDKTVKNFTLAQQQLQQEYSKQASTLENQNTILGFQKQLIEAKQKAFNDSLSITNSELDLASRLSSSDRERKALAQTTASIKLRALEEQQKAEREVLLINQQQAKVQQEIEAIRLKSQQSQNLADQAQAQADLAKIQATPGATPQEILAAQLNIQAKQQAGQALATQAALLPLQQQLSEFTQQQEISNLERRQRLDRFSAESEVASTKGLIGRTRANQRIKSQLLSGVSRDLPSIDFPMLSVPNLSDIQAPNVQLDFPKAPNLGQSQNQPNQQQPQSVNNNNVTLELGGITITAGTSQEVGKGLEQEVLNAFDKIMIETKRRLG